MSSYDFRQMLDQSNSASERLWWDKLLRNWPNYESHVWNETRYRQKEGRDVVVVYMGGHEIEVDVKLLKKPGNAVPLEVWHSRLDTPDGVGWPGWIDTLENDFVVMGYQQSDMALAMHRPHLQRAFNQHWRKRKWTRNKFKTRDEYWTWNVWVPRADVLRRAGLWMLGIGTVPKRQDVMRL